MEFILTFLSKICGQWVKTPRKSINLKINGIEQSFLVNKQKISTVRQLSEYLITILDVNEIQHLSEKTTEN